MVSKKGSLLYEVYFVVFVVSVVLLQCWAPRTTILFTVEEQMGRGFNLSSALSNTTAPKVGRETPHAGVACTDLELIRYTGHMIG